MISVMVNVEKTPWAFKRSAKREANTLISKAGYKPSPWRGIARSWKIDFLIFQTHSIT
jgi:hypothetical protein